MITIQSVYQADIPYLLGLKIDEGGLGEALKRLAVENFKQDHHLVVVSCDVDQMEVDTVPHGLLIELEISYRIGICRQCNMRLGFARSDWLELLGDLEPGKVVPAGKCPYCGSPCDPEEEK